MTVSYEKAEAAQKKLVAQLAKAFNAKSSPLNMGLSKDQPWVGIGRQTWRENGVLTGSNDLFLKVQLVRDLTKEEEAKLPTDCDGLPVKYQKSWAGPL